MTKLHRHGLIAQHRIGVREHTRSDGKLPLLYSLTRRGLETAQHRSPAPAISTKREWRAIEQHNAGRLSHDLHALSWGIELHRLIGDVATDHSRTPRYATGRYPVPQVGSGRNRHPATLRDIPIPDGQMLIDLELKTFTEVKPDLSLEVRVPNEDLSFDLLVELDRTGRASYNRDKFLAYDAFLCGWALAHRRFEAQGTRPAVTFVASTHRAALALARDADETMTGRLGVTGTPPEHWYHPGRDHLFFAVETDIYHDELTALALPPRPPALRERLTGQRDLELTRVDLLPVSSRPVNPKRAARTPSWTRWAAPVFLAVDVIAVLFLVWVAFIATGDQGDHAPAVYGPLAVLGAASAAGGLVIFVRGRPSR